MTKNAKLTPLQKAHIVMAEKRAAGELERIYSRCMDE